MAEMLITSNIQSMFAQLGTFVDKEFIPSDNCYSILMHIYEKLITEDKNLQSFRLNIGFSQIVKKDLVPILVAVNNEKILELVIKVLITIMTPVECLNQHFTDNIACLTILKLNWCLTTNKIAFINANVFKRITHILKENLMKLSVCQGYFNNYLMKITDCLHLLKSILHVPNDHYQNYILLELFSENFDEILIDLINNSNRKHWVELIIELIALMYKNQHVDQMTKLLSKNNETIISDSSEDNESNTSPHSKNGTRCSQEEFESLNSDDNDTDHLNDVCSNELVSNKLKEKLCDIKTIDIQNKNSSNVSLHNLKEKFENDEPETNPIFKEPTSLIVKCNLKNGESKEKMQLQLKNSTREKSKHFLKQLKNEFKNKTNEKSSFNRPISNKKSKLRMKKITKKSLKTKLHLSILPKNLPNEESISHFFQKFTIHFLQYGFNTLVDEIYNLLTTNSHQCIDTSLYFWILTYFCRFCKLIQIDLKSASRIVSLKLLSYIVHEGLKIFEQLMIAKWQKSHSIHLKVRHLHLVIMAIKEVIKTIEFYRLTAVQSPFYIELIKDLKNSGNNSPKSVTWAKDLKSIFSLLIRNYDSNIQVIDYLQDLIVTNHMVLSLFDNLKDCWNLNEVITEHIKKFAAPDIMFNYGIVLQNYNTNDELINEAIFTMIYHIIGEVENTAMIFQPIIVKTFMNIFDEKNYLYDRWSDMIEYVINKFLSLSQTKFSHRDALTESLRTHNFDMKDTC